MAKPVRLEARLQPLQPSRGKWSKSALTAKRVTGRARQERNHRIKPRDRWTCAACSRITTELEVDHKIPLSEGGSEDDSNLQCLCAGRSLCHDVKTKAEHAVRNASTFHG